MKIKLKNQKGKKAIMMRHSECAMILARLMLQVCEVYKLNQSIKICVWLSPIVVVDCWFGRHWPGRRWRQCCPGFV
jgi:hypothetical protein